VHGYRVIVQSGPGRVVRRGGSLLPRGRGWFWVSRNGVWSCYSFAPFRGICLRWRGCSRCGGFPAPTDAGYREGPSMKKKSAAGVEGDAKHLAPIESEVMCDHLALIEHCAVVKYDDGDARIPGWFTVRTQGRSWVIDVKDPDSGCSFRVLATTFDEAFETVQELLCCEAAPWEPDRYLQDQQKKAKKK